MVENGLHRLLMLACGVMVFGFMWVFLFVSVGEDESESSADGYVTGTTTDVLEQSEKRSHKY